MKRYEANDSVEHPSFGMIVKMCKSRFSIRCVRRHAYKAINKILDAQVLLAGIQGEQKEENEILFWCDKVEGCMNLVTQIHEYLKEE